MSYYRINTRYDFHVNFPSFPVKSYRKAVFVVGKSKSVFSILRLSAFPEVIRMSRCFMHSFMSGDCMHPNLLLPPSRAPADLFIPSSVTA